MQGGARQETRRHGEEHPQLDGVTLAAIRSTADEDDSVFAEPSRPFGFVLGMDNLPPWSSHKSKSLRTSSGVSPRS